MTDLKMESIDPNCTLLFSILTLGIGFIYITHPSDRTV